MGVMKVLLGVLVISLCSSLCLGQVFTSCKYPIVHLILSFCWYRCLLEVKLVIWSKDFQNVVA